MTIKHDTAILVGRFQVPELHPGHVELIKSVFQKPFANVIILLGVAPFTTDRNPMSFLARQKMIQATFPKAICLPLPDQATDEAWSQNLDAIVKSVVQTPNPVLFGARDSFIAHYSGRYKAVELEGRQEGLSGSAVRDRVAVEVRESPDFRAGWIHAIANNPARVWPTVDVALWRQQHKDAEPEFLMGRRSTGPTERWRFPGGFVEASDDSVITAGLREVQEETSTSFNPKKAQIIGSVRIDDWRVPSGYSILTTLITAPAAETDFTSNAAQAGDDLAEARWFALSALRAFAQSGTFVPEHYPLISLLLQHYDSE